MTDGSYVCAVHPTYKVLRAPRANCCTCAAAWNKKQEIRDMRNHELHCAQCGVSFKGAEIPAKDQRHFGGRSYFSRVIARIDQKLDRVVEWMCPDCGFTWERK